MSSMFTRDRRLAEGKPVMLKTDRLGNRYALQSNGEIWLWLSVPRYGTNLGDIVGKNLVITRTSTHWDGKKKGWGISIPLLKWQESFPFQRIVVTIAITPKGRWFTGSFSRQHMRQRSDNAADTRLYDRCLREVLFYRSDLYKPE